ncbi:MAG: gamma-glutamylcysteine synthetase [Streptococcaceae bacterium]|jgi:gamma-glutamylcysteine synthetase|nr:gamma-glutamylcysteine synthetase [Streptococcaceae bacterium]
MTTDRLGRELLYRRYIKDLPVEQKNYIGIELEFPIVNLAHEAVDINFVRTLMLELCDNFGFEVIKRDSDGLPIEIIKKATGDVIVFEVSYNNLEFALGKVSNLWEAHQKITNYLDIVQDFLALKNHRLTGLGVNPDWQINDNQPVKTSRYQMLTDYLESYQAYDEIDSNFFHHYPRYGAFISGSQVQLDVTKDNLLDVLNIFNQIEPAKAWLFGNSYFWHKDWQTTVARDIFWENSMHGIFPNNAGLFPCTFENIDDYLDYLEESVIFQVNRNEKNYYFPPIKVNDYFNHDEIVAVDLLGKSSLIIPDIADIAGHRSYNFQDLTTRGTVEFRSVCEQPMSDILTVAAFHVGLFEVLDAVGELLKTAAFIEKYGASLLQARRYFARIDLSDEATEEILEFTKTLLFLAEKGLVKRRKGEEIFLKPLFRRLKTRKNPALTALDTLKSGVTMNDIVVNYGRIDHEF